MKRLSKLLLALFIACSITGCSQSTEVVDATYEIYIAGYDWGCGVNKTILTLDKAVDDVDKNDFMVSETKQVTDWEDEALPVVEKTLERVVDDAYSCDKDGQKIDGESKYIAIELYVSPNDGSPLLYSATTHYNTWSDPYYLNISLAKNGEITVDDKKVTKLDVSTEYTKKITAADALELEKFKASDGIELNYGHFNPKEPSNTLFGAASETVLQDCSRKRGVVMGTWNSRGLRGSTLEDMINYTNTRYEEMGLALIQKVPTPITPVRIDKERRHITLAYFDKVSTVDYIGAVQGIPICFDAKECAADTFPLQNVHEHQVSFMEKYEKQQGISFLIIYYSQKETLYYMRFEELLKFWKRAQSGGRKSIRFEELSPEYFMALKNHCFVPYLDYIQKDLDDRD